ncbi:uncharacterized protein BCR38DRAFT_210851 [Pseudomassariella vexata]|uniref:Rhomboid-type serine protease n=1 Tax=Pseudomassariella vexata TaxID=1141098 RepID=A0A1Y2DYE2_9PEZI|nr:uncharacterized protein BCR38DRAFT_210851 [Pseudomassariella vexata]ORY64273.1 hypothetical protein BCR38DRAFT_210851 [Pseudomassariella vexata]
MAANDYYNDASSSRPYYGAYDPTSSHQAAAPSYPPSYASEPPQRPDRLGATTPATAAPIVSPFDTDFDDHVYPMHSQQHSQQSFAQDTRYHSPAPGNVSPVGDDIPLRHQDSNGNKIGTAGIPLDSADHVYDAPEHGPQQGRSRGRRRLQYGELGMLGAGKRRIPLIVYFFSVVQLAVFVGELVKAAQLTGSPIQTSPTFNPMIGPSSQVLINMGSRYVLCMHDIQGISNLTTQLSFACANTTSSDGTDASNQCTLAELCGFGATTNSSRPNAAPNQWWRFIVPIFMHAGIIHIGFNLLLQLTLGKEIERAIGSIRFFLVYMSAGIFGFVMGGNYAAEGISSTGASGGLFGIIALTLLDLLYSWKERRSPVRELMFILIEVVISFVLGLLPGLDNFSHIGGFLMGLCLGICVLHSPNALREKIGEDHFAASYSSVNNGGITSVAFPPFLRNPVGFFKGRKGLWWAWWLVRAAFLITIIVVFILLLNNFYTKRFVLNQNSREWYKYLSCLPVNNWCDIGNVNVTGVSKRSIEVYKQVVNLY